jgi:hypothetical protein
MLPLPRPSQAYPVEPLSLESREPLLQNLFGSNPLTPDENTVALDAYTTPGVHASHSVSTASTSNRDRQYFDWTSTRNPSGADEQSAEESSSSQQEVKNDKNHGKKQYSQSLFSRLISKMEDSWLIEILSLAMSLLALIAIIAILAAMNQRVYRDWPYSITLNTAIAILSQTAQITMLFTTAECIGQHRWLWFQKKRNLSALEHFDNTIRTSYSASINLLFKVRSLAVIGALIFIASAAFGPMLQQMADYPERSFRQSSTGAVSLRARQFRIQGKNKLPVEMFAVIQASILQPIQSYNYQPICSESNCTWDPFPSLAICGTCEKLSLSNWTNTCGEARNNDYDCSWDLPGIVSLPIKANFSGTGYATAYQYISTTDVPINTSGIYLGMGNPIITFVSMGFDRTDQSILFEGPPLQSNLCSFSYCVQTLNVSLTTGNSAKNQIIHTWFNNTLTNAHVRGEPQKYGDLILRPSDQDLNITLSSRHGPATTTIDNIPANLSIPGVPQSYNFSLPANSSVFLVSWNAQGSLEKGLRQFFNTSFEVYRDNSSKWHSHSLNGDVTEYLAQNDVGSSVKSVALSLSQYLRTSHENTLYNVTGFATHVATIVNVTWAWVTLPLALVLASIAFLVATMYMSSEKMLWKSSNTALLLYGQNSKDAEKGNAKKSDLNRLAHDSTLLVQEYNNTWRLIVEKRLPGRN